MNVCQRYTESMDFKFASKTVALVLVGSSFVMTASAQWLWIGKDGHKVFSDRSPPGDVLDKDIIKRPNGTLRPANQPVIEVPQGRASAPVLKASAPRLSGKDAELEARKKKAEDEEASKRKAEEEKAAKTKADNCDRAKTSLATLQSGVRIASVNANGEREIMDDDKRDAESKRAQSLIDSSCK